MNGVLSDLWLITSVVLFSFGHWIGGTVCLVAGLAHAFYKD